MFSLNNVAENSCHSPIPPPYLMEPVEEPLEGPLLQLAVYDRLWCGGELAGMILYPNTEGMVRI